MNIASHKKTILIIILILLAFFGYWFFFLSKKDTQNNINQANNQTNQNLKSQNVSSNTQYDKDFVTSLLGLNSVNLDVSILKLKTYEALSYPKVPFVLNYSKDSGRPNPFLPIGFDGSVSAKPFVEVPPVATTTPKATTASSTPAPAVKPVPKNF